MSTELNRTREHISIYNKLSGNQMISLAEVRVGEEGDARFKENDKFLTHLGGQQSWRNEWAQLWSDAHRKPSLNDLPENMSGELSILTSIWDLAWATASMADLAYLLRNRITEETFTMMTETWDRVK